MHPLLKNSIEIPQNFKVELPYVPAIPFLGIYPKKMKTLTGNQTSTQVFTAVLCKYAVLCISKSQDMEVPKY